ncbi:junctional adhesion molecule-like [Mytilus californianus]|uniref:junctional adhesion molecule-like n=1 Tax=Mytilus californianus TaxID=6549 RepID=UPI0022460C47|nr:junctional adhesion molecule-like [Mytilus californianus]
MRFLLLIVIHIVLAEDTFGEIVLSNKAQHTHIGKTVVLSCKYPHGATKIRWRSWQGIIAKSSDLELTQTDDMKRFNVVANQMKGEYNLEISDVIQPDSGLYWCEMQIGGDITQQRVTLYIDKFGEIVLSNKAQHTHIGETVVLSCRYHHGATKIRWRRWQGIIAKASNLKLKNADDRKRFNVVADRKKGDYNLKISDVEQSDSGLYWCEMRIGGKIMQQKVTLYIDTDDKFVLSNKAQHAYIGEKVVLSCKYPRGATKVRWRRWQGIIAKGLDLNVENPDDRKRFNVVVDEMKGEYNFEISGVIQSDSGLYWCEMRFGGQIMQQKVTLQIGKLLIHYDLLKCMVTSYK